MHPFWYKLLAAVTTVGFGGSAALEGPSIYGGGAIGSWLWTRLKRLGLKLEPRDRRIMLISGAAAGMAAVFRAPLTGLIFALEMPYKDDLAHEALLPSLIASVVSYAVLVAFMGTAPLFAFGGAAPFSDRDLLWSALLGVICGFIAMNFANGFRRTRNFFVNLRTPHTVKLLIGGLLTGICGLAVRHALSRQADPAGPQLRSGRHDPEPSARLGRAGDVRDSEAPGDAVLARLRRSERDVRAAVSDRRRNRQGVRPVGGRFDRAATCSQRSGWRRSSRPATRHRWRRWCSWPRPAAAIPTSFRRSSARRSPTRSPARPRSRATNAFTRRRASASLAE